MKSMKIHIIDLEIIKVIAYNRYNYNVDPSAPLAWPCYVVNRHAKAHSSTLIYITTHRIGILRLPFGFLRLRLTSFPFHPDWPGFREVTRGQRGSQLLHRDRNYGWTRCVFI